MSTHRERRPLLLAIAVLASAAACTTYSNAVEPGSLTPQRHIKVEFSSPTSLRLACDSADMARFTSSCDGGPTMVTGVLGFSGRVTQVAADSVLVRLAELRDSTGLTVRYEPPRETWLVRGLGVVEARNTDTGHTLIMVVLAAATVAAVIAAANAPQPTPKPNGGTSCW
ncbi:MAG TPA: hypothetical protein VL157_08390 [Gemmatimonadaceae bacterium]|jgi:hypothetical protein|nr:hypothetical protein [Gemmatimonadaceae bacterium]